MDHTRRMGALRRKLSRAGLSGLLVTHLPDLRYLTGFTGSSAALAVTRFKAQLFTDGRYRQQAADEVRNGVAEECSGKKVCDIIEHVHLGLLSNLTVCSRR